MKNTNYGIRITNHVKLFSILLTAYCLLLTVNAQNGGTQQNLIGVSGTFAITGARIVTVSGADISKGTIVIRDGKIAALGANTPVPGGATRIDGTGLSVYPGMIDAGTNMGLLEIGNAVIGTVDVAETGNINPNAKAILGLNPNTSHINVTRVAGITMVQSMPRGGIISGQSTIINLNGATQDEMAVRPLYALVVNFPTISTFAGFSPGVGPRFIDFGQAVKRRDKRVKELKEAFEKAKRYAKVKTAFSRNSSLPKQNTELKMEAMFPYVNGSKPIIFNAQRARDIRAVVKFVEEMKVKAIIYGGAEAWKEAAALKKNNIPVIYNRIHSNPARPDDPYDTFFEAPSKMQKAGITFCISTGNNGAMVRELPFQAGMASAYGLPKAEALKAVTIYPAQILGVGNMVGSLEVGKVANIVVTDGDLLEIRTNIKHMFIGGRQIPLTSRHTELFEAFKDRKLPQ